MNWKTKAFIMKLCNIMPFGDRLYLTGQRWVGRLHADPLERLPSQATMLKWLHNNGLCIDGLRFFEVGTGHIPIVPIGLFLCGAGQTITVDLHRRIDWGLTRDSLEWIKIHRDEVWSLYDGLIDEDVFKNRFDMLAHTAHNPQRFFEDAAITYLAPMNAADTSLPDHSVDCHISVTVLEHIPPAVICDIFTEAKRILDPNGVALHFVDMSDHFQHQDKSITRINFLRYSEAEWQRIAGNQFAYCNRMRASDFLAMFRGLDFKDAHHEIGIDQDSMSCLEKKSIFLDEQFQSYTNEDICTTSLKILLQKLI